MSNGPGDRSNVRERALERQLERYLVRFNDAFWDFFEAKVQPRLPASPVLVDLGCGPGLFLRDVSARLPSARLSGYDQAQDMLDSARGLDYAGGPPVFDVCDVSGDLPIASGSVDLPTIAAVMHPFADPFAFLDEVRRVLAPRGLFLLYDWIRVPMRDYIAYREREPGDPPEVRRARAVQMFGTHNTFTDDDWQWILAQARYEILDAALPYPRARAFLTRPAGQAPVAPGAAARR